jgi:hypothetical protein
MLDRGWKRLSPAFRFASIIYFFLLMTANVQLFGRSQFGKISRAIGGGKPELAYLQLSENQGHLIDSFALNGNGITNKYGYVGPVTILLRTERDLLLLESSPNTTNMNAKQIRADLIESIRFAP